MPRPSLLSILILAAACAAFNPKAATATPATTDVPAADLKQLNDPTILSRRVWLETEWNKFTDHSSIIEETLGGMWAWRISDHQDWAIRLKVPMKFRTGGEDAGLSDLEGLGDIKLATGTAFRLSKTLRFGL